MMNKQQAQQLADRIMDEIRYATATIDSGDLSSQQAGLWLVVVSWIGHQPIVIRSAEQWEERKHIVLRG